MINISYIIATGNLMGYILISFKINMAVDYQPYLFELRHLLFLERDKYVLQPDIDSYILSHAVNILCKNI